MKIFIVDKSFNILQKRSFKITITTLQVITDKKFTWKLQSVSLIKILESLYKLLLIINSQGDDNLYR
jgi:transketolase N-terminal domain/subunit